MEKFSGKFIRPIKKTLGLVGAIGLGYLGGIQEGQAGKSDDSIVVKNQIIKKTEQAGRAMKRIPKSIFDKRFSDEEIASYFSEQKGEVVTAEEIRKHRLMIENADGAAKFKKDIKEDFNPNSLVLLKQKESFKLYLISLGKDRGHNNYAVRDERYGETLYFDAKDDQHAEVYARRFYEDNPRVMELVDKVRSEQQDLMEKGFLKMPNGKHGIMVPNSERVESGKKIHTEIRKIEFSEDPKLKLIAMWTIGEDNEELGYKTYHEGTPEYENYFNIIKIEKQK